MSSRKNSYPVTKRKNWSLTTSDKMHVPYTKSYKLEEGIYVQDKYGNYWYTLEGVISFKNHLHLMHKLKPVQRALLTFLTQKMNPETNEIINSLSLRTEFVDFMKRCCSENYKDRTVNLAFGVLKKVGYIINRSKAKRTTINPLYFFRGSMAQREELFKELLKEAAHPKTLNQDIVQKI